MLSLIWTAEHECKKQISAEGISANIHLVKDSSFQFPESGEKEIRRQFSDALSCGYCKIEKVESKPDKRYLPAIEKED